MRMVPRIISGDRFASLGSCKAGPYCSVHVGYITCLWTRREDVLLRCLLLHGPAGGRLERSASRVLCCWVRYEVDGALGLKTLPCLSIALSHTLTSCNGVGLGRVQCSQALKFARV